MYYQKGEPQEKHFEDYLKNNRYPFTVTLAGQAPFLKLAGTWEEGMTRLHRKFRTELRSREKKLRERGRIELKFMDRQDSWEAGMSAIEEIEQQSWKPTGGFPIIHPHHWSFYYKYAAQAASKSTLCVPILYVNDEPVAFDYGIYHDGTYYLLQTSYKERWNECYPGSVLRKLVIEWLHDIHAEEIDFGIGDDIWKRKWTDATREYRLYTVFNHSLRGNYLSLVSRITKIFGKY
jgi:CelD/BcsL family acetyltransferase involved in cellulose biosynthesis